MKIDSEEVPIMHDEVDLYVTYGNGQELKRRGKVVWFIKKAPPEVGALVGVQFL